MNTEKDFIYNKIHELVKKYKRIKASVSYEGMGCAYYVQIQPSDFLSESLELREDRLLIQDEFYNNNFNASLIFVNEESLLELKTFDYSFIGECYTDIKGLIKFSVENLKQLNNEVTIFNEDTMIEQPYNFALAA